MLKIIYKVLILPLKKSISKITSIDLRELCSTIEYKEKIVFVLDKHIFWNC